MLFRSHVPRAPLSEFVEDFRLYEDYAGRHGREMILPSGTFELVINLLDDELRIYDPSDPGRCRRFAGALVSGPYARPFMTDTAEEAAILQVHFRPGGAAPFLGLPARELVNSHVDLRTLWGSEAPVLRERLCALRGPAERFRLLEATLLARLPEHVGRHGATRLALATLTRSHGRARVRDLAQAADMSQRRLVDVFAADVGLTPKLFARIRRFQHSVALAQRETEVDWAELALACGYFDQAHLVRDFVEFSGLSPGRLRRRQAALHHLGQHVKRHHLPAAG